MISTLIRRKLLQGIVTAALIGNTTPTTSAWQSSTSTVNFSGKWTLAINDGEPLSPLSSPLGREGVISQDSSTITFRQTTPPALDPSRALTYRLDGKDSQNLLLTAAGGSWVLSSQARWVTNALIITTKTNAGGTGHWEDLMVVSLADGDTLKMVLVNTTLAPQVMQTATLTYRKS